MTSKELKLLGKALKALLDNGLTDELKEIIYEMAEEENDNPIENKK